MRFEKKVEQLRIQKHDGKETEEFLKDVIKMAQGEPLEYILGEVTFCGTVIDLSLRPMIPRPETEYWVYQAIQDTKDNKSNQIGDKTSNGNYDLKPLRVLDLFSGSGNVGISFLKKIKECTVDMIEIDPNLKKQIEISLIKNIIDPTRVKIITGDTWEGATGVYDIITVVPPYVPPQMKDEVMKELHAEAPLAFFDKEDGYFYHKQVLSRASEFLKKGGELYLEFDITQKETIEKLAQENSFNSYTFLLDPYRHEFLIRLVK